MKNSVLCIALACCEFTIELLVLGGAVISLALVFIGFLLGFADLFKSNVPPIIRANVGWLGLSDFWTFSFSCLITMAFGYG
jgi:hypothetical protein